LAKHFRLGLLLIAIMANSVTSAQIPNSSRIQIPKYPPLAALANIHGKVQFEIQISQDGSVESVTALGPKSELPQLKVPLASCVAKWIFQPGTPRKEIFTFDLQILPWESKLSEVVDEIQAPNLIIIRARKIRLENNSGY
jgi:hypothetical protein